MAAAGPVSQIEASGSSESFFGSASISFGVPAGDSVTNFSHPFSRVREEEDDDEGGGGGQSCCTYVGTTRSARKDAARMHL